MSNRQNRPAATATRAPRARRWNALDAVRDIPARAAMMVTLSRTGAAMAAAEPGADNCAVYKRRRGQWVWCEGVRLDERPSLTDYGMADAIERAGATMVAEL